MKLLLRRGQRASGLLTTTITFSLHVRAELTPEEKAAVAKYKLGQTMLYERNKVVDPGSGLLGLASRLAMAAVNLTILVDDLERGKKIDCKSIVEMLAVEVQVKEAAEMFKKILDACRFFDGEEVIEF